jgi:hypothetical protein
LSRGEKIAESREERAILSLTFYNSAILSVIGLAIVSDIPRLKNALNRRRLLNNRRRRSLCKNVKKKRN